MLTIKAYQHNYDQVITELFFDTVHHVGKAYYSTAQLNAWAPLPIDYQVWRQKLGEHKPWLAFNGEKLVGFMSLSDNGLIHFAFCHKDYQRKGVASYLYAHIESQAKTKGIEVLTTHASYLAKPFFAKQGFDTLSQNENPVRGEQLTNFTMEKRL